jgi:integrase/recombinase XerC/integrase/recombinase XerD
MFNSIAPLNTINNAPQHIANKAQLLDLFITEQDVHSSSRDTYRRTLRQFINWTDANGYTLADITYARLINYKDELLKSKSSLSVASYITSVRKFYKWTESRLYFPNVARELKTPKRKQEFRKESLTPDEAAQLLTHVQTSSGLRDYAIVNLMLRTGLRCIEVTRSNFEDITVKNGQRILNVQGKGRDEKDEFVILTDKAYEPLRQYLESRTRIQAKEPLFTNHRNQRLTTRSVYTIAKEALKSIGLHGKEYTAHSLRHTAAVSILRAGGLLEDAQAVLRHASPVTTQIYLQSIKEEHRLNTAAEKLIDKLY